MKKLILFSIAATLLISVSAQTSGPNYPGTTANVALGGSAGAWTAPGNIVSDNASYASITLNNSQYSDYLTGRNYSFSIPAGATINGIVVEIDRYGSTNNRISDRDVYLTKNGTTSVGTDKAAGNWPGSSGVQTYGGAADLWGTTWTPAEINNANFGVMLSAQSSQAGITANVDYIRVTVYYTAPFNDDCATAIPITASSSCSYATYTNVGATASAGAPAPGCANYVDDDVWFSVLVPACGHLIFDTDDGGITDGGMAIYSGTCGSLSLIDCDDDASVNGMMPYIDATGLTPGSTIYIRVWEYGGDVNGTFGICVYNPDPDCSGTPAPGATTANPTGTVCISDAVTLSTSQTASCGLTYQWQSSPNNTVYTNIAGATSSTYVANPTTTTWYRLQVTCTYSGLSATSTPVEVPVATTTSTCANATVISSIPYSATGMTTCCMGDDYNSTDACGSSYMNGEDYVFKYTPAADIIIDITLTGTLSYTGVFVTERCPDAGGASCVAQNTNSSGNPSLCGVSLDGGTTYYIIVDTYPSPDCTPFNISITNSSSPVCNLNYSVAPTAYSLTSMIGATTLNITVDDVYNGAYTPIGFTFCYDGIGYTQCLVSSNGYIIFDPISCTTNQPSSNATPGGWSDYDINMAIPNTTEAPRNCIMFPWMDTDPNDGGVINCKLSGTAPNRVFVVQYSNVWFFSSSCTGKLMSAQVKLFETSNNIEVHITRKDTCNAWNEAASILGLHNYNGTLAVVPAGYNYPNKWTATNQAWRFTCGCAGCSVLPVEYLNFSGEKLSDQVNRLKWTTATETNNDRFEVQRKDEAGEFISIGIVEGAGNSNSVIHYSFTDEQASAEATYYRLMQVDHNGDMHFSSVITVGEFPEMIGFKSVYPNPASDQITVNFSSNGTPLRLVLVASNGQEYVLEQNIQYTGETKRSYPIENIPSGVYLLKADNAKHEFYFSEKIVIQ